MKTMGSTGPVAGTMHSFMLLAAVTDAAAVHRAAAENCRERGMTEEEAGDAIGSADAPKIDGCLMMLLDPIEQIPGVEIEDSSARVVGARTADVGGWRSSSHGMHGAGEPTADGVGDDEMANTISVDTMVGERLYPAPARRLPDRTAVHVWVRLLNVSLALSEARHRTKRDRQADEAVREALAVVLANAAGMAGPYWSSEADRLCGLLRRM